MIASARTRVATCALAALTAVSLAGCARNPARARANANDGLPDDPVLAFLVTVRESHGTNDVVRHWSNPHLLAAGHAVCAAAHPVALGQSYGLDVRDATTFVVQARKALCPAGLNRAITG